MVRLVCLCLYFLLFLDSCYAQIPGAALQHRSTLIRVARDVWGLDAPVALFAAQVHAESTWRENAVSYVGAQGLAQFMPKTAEWLPKVAPDTGEPLPFNAAWSLRALVTYDLWLWERVKGMQDCEQVAFMLSAYNGGLGWVQKDKNAAQQQGLDPEIYWENVEHINAGRRASAFKENRQYPRKILFTLQGLYEQAGWGQGVWCDRR